MRVQMKEKDVHDGVGRLQALENKLLLTHEGRLLMLTNFERGETEETYRHKRKEHTRTVPTFEFELVGYNSNGEFVSSYEEWFSIYVINRYDLYAMRRHYLDHIKALTALQEYENELQNIECHEEN